MATKAYKFYYLVSFVAFFYFCVKQEVDRKSFYREIERKFRGQGGKPEPPGSINPRKNNLDTDRHGLLILTIFAKISVPKILDMAMPALRAFKGC